MKRHPSIAPGMSVARMLGLFLFLAAGRLPAADWPQWLGPDRSGGVDGDPSATGAEEAAFRTAWKVPVGAGFSSPVVAGPHVYLFHRRGDREILSAWEADGGKPVWEVGQPTDYVDDFGFDEGPRGTPVVAGDAVFTFGAGGRLSCHARSDGVLRWSVDTVARFGAGKGFFGFACSPLVVDDRVVVQVGGRDGAGVMAFRVADGAVVWKAVAAEAGYASPVRAEGLDGRPVLAFHREGLTALDPATGAERAAFPWRSRQQASVNAASPVVLPDGVFLTSSYGTGAVRLRWDAGRWIPVWQGDDSLSAHYATPVHHRGHLYGFHGRQEYRGVLRCIDAATGKVRWEGDDRASGTLVRVGERLVVLLETGELLLVAADPARYRELVRRQVLGSGCRSVPAVAGSRIFVRDPRTLVCVGW